MRGHKVDWIEKKDDCTVQIFHYTWQDIFIYAGHYCKLYMCTYSTCRSVYITVHSCSDPLLSERLSDMYSWKIDARAVLNVTNG